jgi:two-component system, chemotaxis family, sensor histidine kinase and response regulator PixL
VSNILVIEDDFEISELLRDALELAGHHVLSATQGESGLEILQQRGPTLSLVVLDLMMPQMNGWQFLEERRHLPPEARRVPVLVFTAVGNDDFIPREPLLHFIRKPLELEEFLRAVAKHLTNPLNSETPLPTPA